MKALIVLNRNPYDGTDITWNALRLAEQLLNAGLEVNMFLMKTRWTWLGMSPNHRKGISIWVRC